MCAVAGMIVVSVTQRTVFCPPADGRLSAASAAPVAVASLSISNVKLSDFAGDLQAHVALKTAIRDQVNSVYQQSNAQVAITSDDVSILGFDESALRMRRLVRIARAVCYVLVTA